MCSTYIGSEGFYNDPWDELQSFLEMGYRAELILKKDFDGGAKKFLYKISFNGEVLLEEESNNAREVHEALAFIKYHYRQKQIDRLI